MPSPEVERILDEYRKNPGPVLALPGLTESNFADLARAADSFSAVEELRIQSDDADWTTGGLTIFALRLKNLSRLDLSGSRELSDTDLRGIADKLPALTALNLTWCEQVTDAGVKALADTLPALTTLDLNACDQVTDAGVKALADKLPALIALNLTWCKQVTDAGVKALADKLPALTTLDLAYCDQVTDAGVKALADKLPALTVLNLNACDRVTDAGVKALADKLPALTVLNLNACDQVTDAGVKALADKLPALTALNLAYCDQVTDAGVKALADKLPALTALNLNRCKQVTDAGVKAIADELTVLTTLNLAGCDKVTVLPRSIARLRDLELLDLRGTRLVSLPFALRELPRLCFLDVSNIPTLELPDELTRNTRNPRAILDHYFRGRDEGQRTLNEAKLILVGNEAVGKTSLVNFLVTNKPCKDTPKTPGVEIVEGVDVKGWDVNRDAAGGAPLRLNVWDFGGQQVLYETHQFFLTARSLYLVVLSARKENETEQEAHLIGWLRSIRARTIEDVPVIVVVNKSEGQQALQIDEDRLKREFPVIKRFVRTSCRAEFKGRGIDELRRAVVEVIRAELPHVRDQFPQSYFNVKEELAKTARLASILNTRTFRNKCRAQKITDRREQKNLLELLDRIGVVVKYDDTTLLDPNWLTTAVYRVLTHPDVVAAGGEFAVSALGALLAGLAPKDYPPERWPFIAEMMERFGLSFRLPAPADHYLVPNQFHVAEPALPGWDAPGLLRFRYEYRHPPARGLLPRFVVFAHRHLTRPRIAWLNGVVLGIQGCEVLVKMEPHERRLEITVRGPELVRRSALAVVREHFAAVHDLNKLAPGADVFARIPVEIPGAPGAAFDFEFLETCERTNVPRVPCPGTSVLFSVRELLAGVGPEPLLQRLRASARKRAKRDEPRNLAPDGGDVYHIHGNAEIYKARDIHQPHQESNMGDKINITGNVSGSAIGRGASVTAEQIITTIRQQLPPSATSGEELKEIVKAALAQLASEKLDPDDHKEAQETVEKIEKEMAKPDPSKERVGRWVGAVEQISAVTGGVLRAAGSIAALFG
ncbi:hypothetical protein J8F10_13215 [Gemmata sp. G18]|uniref:non-specific serine/threonine protein kinase n=1 Tax=Gemmata palustris TaxID=2822762 RepID=A0ABS5BRD4_9BACT|nr:COR domain-containing protein [Gemmata palustris]MBP3956243.1 hypothetical protein [Gemmata palustris]